MRGIITVAFGKAARRCAKALIRTVRKYAPGVPVCVIADRELTQADVTIERAPMWGGRYYKVNVDRFAPQEWQRILYFDADTLVIDGLELFWQALADGWDTVFTFGPDWANTVAGNQRPAYEEENVYTSRQLGGRFWHQPMSGVFAWQRNEQTAQWHATWANEWERYGRRDQQAMVRALWASPVTTWWLGCEWNYFLHRGDAERGEVVLHFPTAARPESVKHPGKALWQEYSRRIS